MLKFILHESKFPLYFSDFHLKRRGFSEFHNVYPHRPVMVVPGMWTSDAYTQPLRSSLGLTGLDVHGWGLGKPH